MTVFEQYTDATSYECATVRKLVKDVMLRMRVITMMKKLNSKSVYVTKIKALNERLREEYPEEYV